MAINVTSLAISQPVVSYWYDITGLVNGANAITLPAPTLQGSFPPDGEWTPTQVKPWPYNTGAVGALVTVDPTTITNVNGQITFTLYAGGATNTLLEVY
jgi:hypothetical protein